MDINHLSNIPKLPFFYLPQLELKVLIDSGASDSILNFEAAAPFKNYSFAEPFAITSAFNTHYSNENLYFPILSELGINDPIKIRVIPWHKEFNILFETRDLRRLRANINYDTKTLTLRNIEIPFFLEFNHFDYSYEPTSRNVLEISIDIDEGNIFLPSFLIDNDISLPDMIATATNGICKIPYQRPIKITKRLHAIPLCYLFQKLQRTITFAQMDTSNIELFSIQELLKIEDYLKEIYEI